MVMVMRCTSACRRTRLQQCRRSSKASAMSAFGLVGNMSRAALQQLLLLLLLLLPPKNKNSRNCRLSLRPCSCQSINLNYWLSRLRSEYEQSEPGYPLWGCFRWGFARARASTPPGCVASSFNTARAWVLGAGCGGARREIPNPNPNPNPPAGLFFIF